MTRCLPNLYSSLYSYWVVKRTSRMTGLGAQAAPSYSNTNSASTKQLDLA